MSDQIQHRVVRSLAEIEDIRGIWMSWQCHPNSDIDFYLAILGSRPEILQPHIIVVYREGRPDAMLIGRIQHAAIDLKIGYKSFFRTQVRQLNFIYGGLLGNASSDNARLLVNEVNNSLRRGEAEVAFFNNVRADSPMYYFSRRLPSFLSRDHFPTLQTHRSIRLPISGEEFYRGLAPKVRKNRRSEAQKLLRDYAGDVRVSCYHEVSQLGRMIQEAEQIAKKSYQRALGAGFVDNAAMRQRLHLEAAKGWLRAYVLYVAGRPCAFIIGTLYGGTFYNAFMGYESSFGRYSPGTYLLLKIIEGLCNEGVKEMDFGFGDAWYKQHFGNCEWQERSVYVFPPTLKGIGLNVLRTPTMLMDQLAKKTLERTGLLLKIKRIWRDSLRHRSNGKGT